MKRINLDIDLSPEFLKTGIVVGALFFAWIASTYLKEATVRMGSQAVYGEQAIQSSAIISANAQKLVALSIVQSSTTAALPASVSNDQLIEDAFSLPEPVIETKEVEQKKVVTPTMDFFTRYNPRVSGITSNGAFINGHFYAIREPMLSLSVMGLNGQPINPVITKISTAGVSLDLGGAPLTLSFKSY